MNFPSPEYSGASRETNKRTPKSKLTNRGSRKQGGLSYGKLEPRSMLAVVISEFVSSNVSSFEDGYGSSPDWIELYNNGSTPVDLNGYHLSDDPANPFGWRFDQSVILPAQQYMVVFASGNNEVDPGGFFHTDFKLSAGGEYIGLFDSGGNVLSEFGANGTDYPAQVTDISYGAGAGSLITPSSDSYYLVPTGDIGNSWTQIGFDAAAAGFTAGAAAIGYENSPGSNTSYTDLIEIDPELPDGTTTAYLRTEFEVSNSSSVSDLTLDLKYDDGFAVYLNGTFLFSRNAGNGLAWNADASGQNSDQNARVYEPFDLSGNVNLLQDGTNVLAFHALNRPGSSDYLLAPRLSSNSIVSGVGFLETPTPLSTNAALTTLGPRVDNVTESGVVVNPNQSLVISASVTASELPVDTSAVEIHYRRGFSAEVTLSANDNGTGGDSVAGDGIYSATVPNVGGAGEMLRWYVTAEDTGGNLTRAPRFAELLNSAEYFGTVVTDASVDSDLPVLYWFVENEPGTRTDAGARGSLFLNGEFYDNIDTNAHGQSTRGSAFPKKSFDFDANSGDKFRVRDGVGRVSDFNLLTNYADQTKIRHPLAYEVFNESGHPASLFGFSVTVYQNGEYYGLWDLVEEGDEEFLEREGLDTDGALYKINNRIDSATNNVDKKSREYEDRSDLQSIVNQYAAATTASAELDLIYDNMDVATLINYLAVHNLISNGDFGHKNQYWYHDVNETGQWLTLPWDQDLSFGHNWTANVNPPYFDNTLYTNRIPQGGINDVYQRVYSDPALREMYYRRLRTLTDQFFGATGSSGEASWVGVRARELEALNQDEAADDLAEWGLQANFAAAYPFTRADAVSQLVNDFVPQRREYLLGLSATPNAQVGNPGIVFDDVDFDSSPASGQQSEEYIRLNNPTSNAVDISGWELTGGISHTFTAGTVIPSGGTLYVVKDVKAFKVRASDPSVGQKRFIQGNYDGQLASTGETVNLVALDATVVDTLTTPDDGISNNQAHLVVSEINYNPAGVSNSEFIEFFNNSSASTPVTLDLAGVTISQGPTTPFVFPAGTSLAAGQYLVVVQDASGFAAAYPSVSSASVAGVFSGQLSNSGETIRVDDVGGEKILEFDYSDNDPWSPIADGAGGSLELIDPFASVDLLGKYYSWQGSTRTGGSPAAAPAGANASIRINEILAHTDLPQRDYIELFNASTTASPINIGGWYLSDSKSDLRKYQIAANTVIPAGGHLVFDELDFNSAPGSAGSFALSSEGDQVWLTQPINATENAFIDVVEFGATYNGESFGRIPEGTGRLVANAAVTPEAANSAAKVGPILITEVHYNPGDVGVGLDPKDYEFIEIHNSSSASISLQDWEIRGEVDFDFPAMSIAGNQTLVVLRFDPNDAANVARVASFRSVHGIDSSVTLIGGFIGSLSNSWGRVELQSPDSPPVSDPTAIPHVTVDELIYDDLAPWPVSADGVGNSLNRIASNSVGSEAGSWSAASPTPGAVNLVVAGPSITVSVRDDNSEVRPDLLDSFRFTFDADVNVSAGDLTMVNDTLGGTAVSLAGVAFSWDAATFTAVWDFESVPDFDPGYYSFRLSDSVTSVQGNQPIDGDGDGNAGGDYVEQTYIAIPGDANLDGVVTLSVPNLFTRINTGDVAIARSNVSANFPTTWRDGDFNGDGMVSLSVPNLFTRINTGDVAVARAHVGMDVRPPGGVAGLDLVVPAVEFNDSNDLGGNSDSGLLASSLRGDDYNALDSVFSEIDG